MEIYKITNKENGKIYIGLTIQGSRTRFLHHLYEARSGSTFPIHGAIRKYGANSFNQEVIDEVTLTEENYETAFEELKAKEKYWINYYKSNNRSLGYNLTEGGDGTLGRKHSEETKEKIRVAHINNITYKKVNQFDFNGNLIKCYNSIKEASLNTKIVESTIRQGVRRGRTKAGKDGFIWKYENQNLDTKEKNLIARINKVKKEIPKGYVVYQYTKDNILIKKHLCINDAAKETNTTTGNIRRALTGKFKYAKDFKFTFEEIKEENYGK